MTTKFYLRDPNSKKATPINFCFQYSGKRFVYSTKQSIIPSNWNSKKNKPFSSVTGAMTLNVLLDMIERAAKDAYRQGIIDGKQITNEYLRESLNKELKSHNNKIIINCASLEYFSAIDAKKRMKNIVQVKGIPHVMIIDPQGIVRWEGFPFLSGHKLTETVVENLLRQHGAKQKSKAK